MGTGMLRLDTEMLFQMQQELDAHIESEHDLADEDTTDKKILALQVELGELANETRCFKFWSLKPPSKKEIILEEYVDGVHFILSIGLSFGYHDAISIESRKQDELTEEFLNVFDCISAFRNRPNEERYRELFQSYLKLGERLGFEAEEIEAAYGKKNETNHKRQQQGY